MSRSRSRTTKLQPRRFARASGARLGRPRSLPDETLRKVVRLRERGLSLRAIADRLNADAVPTAQGGRWVHTTVARVLRSAALDAEAEARKAA